MPRHVMMPYTHPIHVVQHACVVVVSCAVVVHAVTVTCVELLVRILPLHVPHTGGNRPLPGTLEQQL